MKKFLLSIFTIALCSLVLMGCSKKDEIKPAVDNQSTMPISKDGFLLDTFINIKLYDSNDTSILDKTFDFISKMEDNLSSHKSTTDVYKLNNSNGTPTKVNDDVINCLKRGIYYGNLSKGSFDISIGAVSLLWNFSGEKKVIPDKNSIDSNLKFIDYSKIKINGNEVTLEPKMAIDLGAIAKGYIADKAAEYLKSQGVKSAILNLGGNVLSIGNKNGIPFKVGIKNPNSHEAIVGVIEVSDLSVVTSGTYERFIKDGDKIYHHILDPKTGYSHHNDILQTTIVTKNSIDADALSTTVFLLDKEAGINLVNSLDDVEAMFILSDGSFVKSKNFDKFTKFKEK